MKSVEKIEKAIIRQIAEERKRQGLSYAELARLTGLHYTAISLIERGERHGSFINILKIAKALNVRLDNFIN